MQKSKNYLIRLRMHQHFTNLQEDTESIFHSFSVINWIIKNYNVKILTLGITEQKIPFKIFKYKEIQWYLYQYQKSYSQRKIVYNISDNEKPNQKNLIVVQFKSNASKSEIIIQILDQEAILSQIFQPLKPGQYNIQKRFSRKPNQLIYPYISPESEKKKIMQKQNFDFVFQGGGARVISYFQPLEEVLIKNPNRELNSVIGASAGAQVGLMLSCKTSIQQMQFRAKTSQYAFRSTPIKRKSQLTQQIIKQIDQIVGNIKKFLHNYGIIFHELFDLLKTEILTDDVIVALFQQLSGPHKSIMQCFKFTDDSLQQEVEKNTNYYGLLLGHLAKIDRLQIAHQRMVENFLIRKYAEDKDFFLKKLQINNPQIIQTLAEQSKQYKQNPFPNAMKNIIQALDEQQIEIIEQKKPIPKKLKKIMGEQFAQRILKYFSTSEFRRLSIKLTMQQLYKLSGVQFSCVTIDITDKILRILNHKTAPQLPVAMAICTSTSVPVVFEKPKWKKEYGKYYVHYTNYRKQIDLVGHQFADGGILANLPINYLQNQYIRPMYFNHKTSELTKTYAFKTGGQVEPEACQQKQIKNKPSLSQLIKDKFPKLKLILYQVFYKPQDAQYQSAQQIFELIKKIPMLDSLLNIFYSYLYGMDNFVHECFQDKMYVFDQNVDNEVNHAQMLINIKKLRKKIDNERDVNFKYRMQLMASYLRILDENMSQEQLNIIKTHLKENVIQKLEFSEEKHPPSQEYIQYLSDILYQLSKISTHNLFVNCNNQEIIELKKIIKYMIDTENSFHFKIKNTIIRYSMSKEEKQLKILNEIKTILQYQENQINLIKIIDKFIREYQFPLEPEFQTFKNNILKFTNNELRINLKLDTETQYIYQYIKQVIQVSTSPKIHLIFQGEGINSHYFYLKCLVLIEQYIVRTEMQKFEKLINDQINVIMQKFSLNEQQKISLYGQLHSNGFNLKLNHTIKLKSTTIILNNQIIKSLKKLRKENQNKRNQIYAITCSNYHSLIGFFYATAMPINQIKKQLQNIKNMIEMEANIENIYENKKWVYMDKHKIRNFYNIIWEEGVDLFAQFQQKLNEVKKNKENQAFTLDVNKFRAEFQSMKEIIISKIEETMEFVIQKSEKATYAPNIYEYYSEQFSLKTPNFNYYSYNKQTSEIIQDLLHNFIKRFEDQIKFIVYALIGQKLFLFSQDLNQEDKSKIWKGIIIEKFLKADNIKKRIQERLEEINLPKNINLKDFYQLSPKKIQLTFSGVNLTSKQMVFINHHTFPYMPVWTAIMITTSLSGLFPQVKVQREWLNEISKNTKLNKLQLFFGQQRQLVSSRFISGNMIINFPLNLVTNQKILKKYYGNQRYTYLNFRVKQSKNYLKSAKSHKIKFKRRFVSLNEIVRFISNIKYLSKININDIPFFNNKLKTFDTIIKANNILVDDLYKLEIFEVPRKIQLLEFHKTRSKFAELAETEELKYMAKEFYAREDNRHVTYIKLQMKQTIKINFFSKNKSRHVTEGCKIFYSKDKELNFVELTGKEIVLDQNQYDIYLKFYFVNSKNLQIVLNKYQLIMNPKITSYNQIFQIQYTKTFKQTVLKPVKSTITDEILTIHTILNIEDDGLFCEECHQILKFATNKFLAKCWKCKYEETIKFECLQCIKKYCIKCTREKLIYRKNKTLLVCFKDHILKYTQQYYKALLCDICQRSSAEFYKDPECLISICIKCSSEYIQEKQLQKKQSKDK